MADDTFVGRCRAGTEDLDAIDDWVERWHDGPRGMLLRDFLGMSADDYGAWVARPDSLRAIIHATP